MIKSTFKTRNNAENFLFSIQLANLAINQISKANKTKSLRTKGTHF